MDINAAIVDEVIGVLEKFGVNFSGRGSDPEAISYQAGQYRYHADAVRDSYGRADSYLNNMDWSGPAADAHSSFAQYHMQLANDAANQLDNAADHLEEHASRADQIVRVIV